MKFLGLIGVFMELVRWKNLLIMASCQALFHFSLLQENTSFNYSEHILFFILSFATLFIAAGGYVINDIYDIKCDQINKPNKVYFPKPFSKKFGMRTYAVLSSIGFLLATCFSLLIEQVLWSLFFTLIIFLLYLYSRLIKSIPLLGNLTIAFLTACNLLILLLLPTHSEAPIQLLYTFSFFAFSINLIREMVKDLEDVKGDYNVGMNTLPIILGQARSIKFILLLCGAVSYFFIRFLIDGLKNNYWTQLYFLSFIIVPYFYFCYQLFYANHSKQFHRLSSLLKWILIFGLLLIILLC